MDLIVFVLKGLTRNEYNYGGVHMKKSLLVLSGVLLAATTLAGCSKDNTAVPADKGGSTGKEGNKEPVTIKVQAWYTEAQGNWNATVEAYNKLHPRREIPRKE
jgi:multiple sugar transport system substrate-binding protein